MSGRNFGIPKVTSPAAGGGTQLPGSHSPHDTQRGNETLSAARSSLRRPNSRAEALEPRAGFLFLLVFVLPTILVGVVVLGYAALAPEPVEYLSSVETYRFKGH